MEPITGASALASIVGLIGLWKTEARADETKTTEQYIEWLRRRHHEKLVDLILNNRQVATDLKTLIEDQHEVLLERLDALFSVLAGVTGHVDGFEHLTASVYGNPDISEQAISILRQMNRAGSSRFIEHKSLSNPTSYQHMDGGSGQLEITDRRFVEDDLMTLCEYGLLREDYGSSGSRIFVITRQGARLAE